MILTVAQAIEDSAFDDGVKWQLSTCLPMLDTAIASSAMMQGGLTIAAATPKGGIVVHAKGGWPVQAMTAEHDAKAVAVAVHAAIESATYQGDTILSGLTMMLGQARVAAADDNMLEIAGTGLAPIMVLLAVRTDQQITTLVTTAGLAARVLH